MIETGDLRKGLTLQIDGDLVRVLDFQHVKQGRGSAFVRLTLRNLRTGATTTTTVQAGSRFQVAPLERHRVQFLYEEEGQYHFMDLDSFEQFALDREALGDAVNYLKENMTLDLLTYEGQAVEVELPVTVAEQRPPRSHVFTRVPGAALDLAHLFLVLARESSRRSTPRGAIGERILAAAGPAGIQQGLVEE